MYSFFGRFNFLFVFLSKITTIHEFLLPGSKILVIISESFERIKNIFLVQYVFWVSVLIEEKKNSWKFSFWCGAIYLSTLLHKVSNSMAMSYFICLFFSTKHCLYPCSNGEVYSVWNEDKFIIGSFLWLFYFKYGLRFFNFLFLVFNV